MTPIEFRATNDAQTSEYERCFNDSLTLLADNNVKGEQVKALLEGNEALNLEIQNLRANSNEAALQAQIAEMHNTNLSLIEGNVAKESRIAELMRFNYSLSQDVVFYEGKIGELEGQIVLLKARIAELEKTPVTPTPIMKKPLIGISGGPKIDGACDRWFDKAQGITNVPVRRSKALCPRMHASWKVLGDPTPTDIQIIAAFKNLLDGDKVEVEHEMDVKFRKEGAIAAANLTARLTAKNAFYDQVKRLRTAGQIPKVDVVNTLSAWSFQALGPHDAPNYICRADVLGVDLDGDDSTTGPGDGYADYGDSVLLQAIQDLATANYGGRWTSPEHAWNKTVVGERMAKFKVTIPKIAAFKPEEIQIFDNAGWSPVLNAAELAELKVIVTQYNG